MTDIKTFIVPEIRADIVRQIDGCPFRRILPYVASGEITQIAVADNGLDLADLGALCVQPTTEGEDLKRFVTELREAGQLKQILLGPIKPEARKYGWSIDDFRGDEAIDAFFAPPIYIIKFRGYKWH